MTGFGSAQSELGEISCNDKIRSVKKCGLDIKFNLPKWIDRLETASSDILQKKSVGIISKNVKLLNESRFFKQKRI